jgi:uncharacterized protein (DUF1684 family)
MKKNILYIFCLGILLSFDSCKFESTDPYVQEIKRERFSKDSMFKVSDQSPFDIKGRRELVALEYFEPDSTYRVTANLNLFPHPDSVKMQVTNNSGDQDYFKLGYISFNLKGHACKLNVFQSARMMAEPQYKNDLFCPFTDQTNGSGTHEGGRFLEVTLVPGSDKVAVDFNTCYNPYCAYNSGYTCPIPPAGNHLDFKVEAGEKEYKLGKVTMFK